MSLSIATSAQSEARTAHLVSGLLRPRGIAVVGASTKEGSQGLRTIQQLRIHGYEGFLAGVNPRYDEVGGVPCFPNLRALPHPADLVVIFVPAAAVPGVIEEAGEAGCKVAIVFSSGFAEAGEDGVALQQQLADVATRSGVRVLGPNCQGAVHFPMHIAATFSNAVMDGPLPPTASFAYLGQSGAVGGTFFDLARARGVSPMSWISTGNQVDLDVTEVATALLEDSAPATLCVYLETVPLMGAWERLLQAADAAGTRIAVLRSGRSAAGRRAAASHTGAMVGPERAFELVSEAYGVLFADEVDEFVDLAVASRLSKGGRHLGIITSSGGAGCLLADAAEQEGLVVADLEASTRARLQQVVPAFGAVDNPVDVTAQLFNDGGSEFGSVCHMVAADPNVDQIVVVITNLTGQTGVNLANAVTAVARATPVPVSVVYLAAQSRTLAARAILGAEGVPVFDTGRAAARAIRRLTEGRVWSEVADRTSVLLADVALPKGVLTEAAASMLLDRAGVPHPTGHLVTTAEEAQAAAVTIGERVVLKAQSPRLLHKSEHGGVRVGVLSSEAGVAYTELVAAVGASKPDLQLDGVLVQAMAEPGVELLVGVVREAGDYPPVITVGIGGTTTELYADVASALAPLTPEAALELLIRLKGYPLLSGYRGAAPCDVETAAAAIAAISQLAFAMGAYLQELEVNPLIVHEAGRGATAADFMLITRDAVDEDEPSP